MKIANHKYFIPAGDKLRSKSIAIANAMSIELLQYGVHVRYDLKEPAYSNAPFILDIENNEIVVLDINNRVQRGLTVHSQLGEMKKFISAINDKVIITNQYLADILSGKSNEVSLHIKKTAKELNEIEPDRLATLFDK